MAPPTPAGRFYRVVLFTAAALIAACSGKEPSGPPVPKSVKITADTTSILVGDSATLLASVILSDGKTGPETVTWSSNNAAVMTVSASGVAVAIAEGNAVLTASSGALTASVTRKAYASKATPQLKLTGTTITVTSTPEQIAAGTMAVTRATGAPTIGVGDILMGATSGSESVGYLRKVTAVSGAGTALTLQTVQGKLTEAYEDLSVETTVKPNVARALRAAYLREKGTSSWPEGVSVTPSGEIQFLQVPFNLTSTLSPAGGGGQAQAAISFNGNVRLDFDQFLFALQFKKKLFPPSIELKKFEIIPSIRFGSTVTASASVQGNFASMLGFGRRTWTLMPSRYVGTFSAGPVPFTVYFKIDAYLAPSANFAGEVSQTVDLDYGIQAGVAYARSSGWRAISAPYGRGFTATPPSLNVGGSLGLQVGLVPQVLVFIGGAAGPTVGLDLNTKGEMGLTNNGQSWYYNVDWGTSLSVGAAVEIFGFEVAEWSHSLALGGRPTILGNGGAAASVTMAPSAVTFKIGETQALTPTVRSTFAGIVLPSGTFSCTSSNTTVATVSGCTVTGRAVGTASITATSAAEPAVRTTVPVTVQAAGPLMSLSTSAITATHIYGNSSCPQTIGSVTLTNRSAGNVNWTVATASSSLLTMSPNSGNNVAPNGTSQFDVRFTCAQASSFQGTVVVTARNAAGTTVETYSITVNLTVQMPLVTLSATAVSAVHRYAVSPCPQAIGTVAVTFGTVGGNWATTWSARTNALNVSPRYWEGGAGSGNVLTIYFQCDSPTSLTGTVYVEARNTDRSRIETYSIGVTLTVQYGGEQQLSFGKPQLVEPQKAKAPWVLIAEAEADQAPERQVGRR